MKNKTYLFLAIHGFKEQVLVFLIPVDIRSIEKIIVKKMMDYLPKNVLDLGSEIQKNFIPNPDPGGKKVPVPDPQQW
jgi:hypothetical protein